MKHLDGILKLVETEFEAISKNGKFRSREEIEYVYKLIDIAKDIYCIWKYEEEMGDDYSESYDDRRYRNNGYNEGSYARGGRRRREMTRRNRYSMDGDYIEELRELMDKAPDENTRQSIQRMIQQME